MCDAGPAKARAAAALPALGPAAPALRLSLSATLLRTGSRHFRASHRARRPRPPPPSRVSRTRVRRQSRRKSYANRNAGGEADGVALSYRAIRDTKRGFLNIKL